MDTLKDIAALLAIIGIFVFGAWLGRLKYRECRAHGFSVYYCTST